MARIRTIKPEFPQSESMGRVSRDARLLFIELWTIADDSGRTRAASRMLASLLFPYDDDAPGLIDGWLEELESEGCIVRYQVDGTTYLEIAKWLSHQKIDKPSASKFPSINDGSRILASPRESSPLDQGPRTKDQGREVDQGIAPPDGGVGNSADAEQPEPAQVVKLPDRRIPCPAEKLLEVFHTECPTLPRVIKLNDKRRTHLTSRWREVDADSKFSSAEDGVEIFRVIFRKVNASDFLSGRAKSWHATFDWLTESSTNFLKVCEGHYDNEKNDRRPARQPDWMRSAI